jgi:hypothetical protein
VLVATLVVLVVVPRTWDVVVDSTITLGVDVDESSDAPLVVATLSAEVDATEFEIDVLVAASLMLVAVSAAMALAVPRIAIAAPPIATAT